MKKLFFLAILILGIGIASQGQILTKQIAFGAKGVDSISGAATRYFYVDATNKIANYQVYALQVASVRSGITGSDSSQVSFEVSLDNVNWHKFTGTTPKKTGGAAYFPGADLTSFTTNGSALFLPSTCYFPYVRVKWQHFKAACNVYPQVYVTLKKL